MNAHTSMSASARLPDSVSAPPTESFVLMNCEVCDLVGGPFSVAEAAHLRAIHDRLHHGITMAA